MYRRFDSINVCVDVFVTVVTGKAAVIVICKSGRLAFPVAARCVLCEVRTAE